MRRFDKIMANISGKEYCENCKKLITKKMKGNQQVIYANAEHTLSEGDMDFCDPMFGGVYCCQDCYEEQAGHKVSYKKGFQAGQAQERSRIIEIIKQDNQLTSKFKEYLIAQFKQDDISLCPNCYCMTYTFRDNTCGKCKKTKYSDSKHQEEK